MHWPLFDERPQPIHICKPLLLSKSFMSKNKCALNQCSVFYYYMSEFCGIRTAPNILYVLFVVPTVYGQWTRTWTLDTDSNLYHYLYICMNVIRPLTISFFHFILQIVFTVCRRDALQWISNGCPKEDRKIGDYVRQYWHWSCYWTEKRQISLIHTLLWPLANDLVLVISFRSCFVTFFQKHLWYTNTYVTTW